MTSFDMLPDEYISNFYYVSLFIRYYKCVNYNGQITIKLFNISKRKAIFVLVSAIETRRK